MVMVKYKQFRYGNFRQLVVHIARWGERWPKVAQVMEDGRNSLFLFSWWKNCTVLIHLMLKCTAWGLWKSQLHKGNGYIKVIPEEFNRWCRDSHSIICWTGNYVQTYLIKKWTMFWWTDIFRQGNQFNFYLFRFAFFLKLLSNLSCISNSNALFFKFTEI